MHDGLRVRYKHGRKTRKIKIIKWDVDEAMTDVKNTLDICLATRLIG